MLTFSSRCQHVVEPAEAYIIGPAVPADDPDAVPHQRIGEGEQVADSCGDRRVVVRHVLAKTRLELGDAPALLLNAGFARLVGVEQSAYEILAERPGEPREQRARVLGLLVDRDAHAQAEFGVVLKERVRPGGAAPLRVCAPRRGWQVAAVDGGAAGRVGNEHAVAEELGRELEVGRLATARARARELEERLEQLRRS